MPDDFETKTQLAELAHSLRTSTKFPLAARAGELLAKRFPSTSVDAPLAIDALLATLQQRYHTPIPEAYLSEAITKQLGQRRQLGAFYTPWPLAKYLMRSASELVEKEFPGATPTYLDPAAGAGIFFLANEMNLPAAEFRAWDSSFVAIELAKAIAEARGLGPKLEGAFQHRDALLLEPDAEEWTSDAEPLLVVGNPPYSNFGKRAISPWLASEIRAYRPSQRELKTNLRDVFLLFLRLAESLILRRGQGAIVMVLSTTFLDALTHAQVRASLRDTFDELRILRLQTGPTTKAENLFSIRHPTAACIFVRRNGSAGDRTGRVWQAELSGATEDKLAWLDQNSVATTPWTAIESSDLDAGQGRGGWGGKSTAPEWYRAGSGLNTIFREYISGVQTKNDLLFMARTRSELDTQIRVQFGRFDPSQVQPILVAPFDPWWVYYDPSLLGRARYSVMRHMLCENLGLVFMRQATGPGEYDHFLVTRHLVTDRIFHSRWGAPFFAPLHLTSASMSHSNLSTVVVPSLREGKDSTTDVAAKSWLAYVYAITNSHWYRSRAGDALRRDFPRVPSPDLFSSTVREALTALGTQLIELHAPDNGFEAFQQGDETPTSMTIAGRLPRAELSGDTAKVNVNLDQSVGIISPEAWKYRIGGVEVLRRFLMRRRGTTLFAWEADHFLDVARRLEETIALRKRIDAIPLAEAER